MMISRLLLIVSLLWPLVGFPAAAVFSGNDVKVLKDNLSINNKTKILTGTNDPTSVATTGEPGYIYVRTSTGVIYRKTDSGSSTNWANIGNASVDGVTIEDVGGIRIKDLGVSTAKIAASAVTTAKIADSNVTTAKIADANVTRAKLEAVGNQKGTLFDSTSNSTTYLDLSSVTITTTGRPVFVYVEPQKTADCSGGTDYRLGCFYNSAGSRCDFKMLRDSTPLWNATFNVTASLPVRDSIGSPVYIDSPAAGTYTYKIQGKSDNSGTIFAATCMKLAAYEL